MLISSQLCDEIDEHEKNSPEMIEEEKKKIPGEKLLQVSMYLIYFNNCNDRFL